MLGQGHLECRLEYATWMGWARRWSCFQAVLDRLVVVSLATDEKREHCISDLAEHAGRKRRQRS